jgi:hypothetical protein
MPLIQRNRIEPMVLVIIAIVLFVAAIFSYSDRPVTNPTPDDSSMPGWTHVILFVLIGVLVSLWRIGSRRKREEKNAENGDRSKDLTKR